MKTKDFTWLDLILTTIIIVSILVCWLLEPARPVRILTGCVDLMILGYLLAKIYRIIFWLSKKK